MTPSAVNMAKAAGIALLGVAIAIAAVLVGEYDDAPGASFAGLLLMIGAFVLAFRTARRKS